MITVDSAAVLLWLLALLTAVHVVSALGRLLSHISRYRAYRRSYPAAEPGRVWRYTS